MLKRVEAKELEEFQIIKEFFKPLTDGCKGAQNLSDDVARISLEADEEMVISKDLMVQDVHFLLENGGFTIASKLLRSNLSDLASAGATPKHYVLGFSKNSTIFEKFISDFASGLKSVQDEFGISLIGGDTVTSEKLFFSVTIFGVVKKNKTLNRAKAKKGDLIFLSGSVGDAYLGLKSLQNEVKIPKNSLKYLLDRHFFPNPRINLGKELLKQDLSKCAIDVSDGLFADLKHICQSSKLSAKIYQNKIPISDEAKLVMQENPEITLLDLASGGDDYELIFTVNKKEIKKIEKLSNKLGVSLTCIGEMWGEMEDISKKDIVENFGISLLNEKKQKIKIKKYGYEH